MSADDVTDVEALETIVAAMQAVNAEIERLSVLRDKSWFRDRAEADRLLEQIAKLSDRSDELLRAAFRVNDSNKQVRN